MTLKNILDKSRTSTIFRMYLDFDEIHELDVEWNVSS